MPEVRRFVKDPGHADAYDGLEVLFVRGHNPDLVILDEDGEEVERIDLSPLKTDEIHDMLKEKGFERSEL